MKKLEKCILFWLTTHPSKPNTQSHEAQMMYLSTLKHFLKCLVIKLRSKMQRLSFSIIKILQY